MGGGRLLRPLQFLAVLSPGLFFVVVLALLGVRFGAAMPQVARGEGALSVAFGDARETISRALVHKADSYFHGGVDMECTEDHDHDHDGAHAGCSHEGCAHDGHDHAAEASFGDPWRWINRHIRAPEVERHLAGARTVEMMPWFWAAVKADPHNAEAWTTALYVASHMTRDDALAREILREAKQANPESLEILFAEGKYLYERGERTAAEEVFRAVRDQAVARCPGDAGRLSEKDQEILAFTNTYLKKLGEEKK